MERKDRGKRGLVAADAGNYRGCGCCCCCCCYLAQLKCGEQIAEARGDSNSTAARSADYTFRAKTMIVLMGEKKEPLIYYVFFMCFLSVAFGDCFLVLVVFCLLFNSFCVYMIKRRSN